MDKYSLTEFISNSISFFRTKIFYPKCRLIRFPFYIRGRMSFEGGEGLTLGRLCRFELNRHDKTLFIGKKCEMGDYTHIVALNKVVIGDDVLIASKCFISDTNHGCYDGIEQDSPYVPPNQRQLTGKPVVIGNRVWIGENAVILAGAHIGAGCIIGANSVVRPGEYEKNSMIAGVPAKIVKQWDERSNEWRPEK